MAGLFWLFAIAVRIGAAESMRFQCAYAQGTIAP